MLLKNKNSDVESVDWQKIALIPMLVLVVSFLLLLLCFGFWEGRRLDLAAQELLERSILDQRSALTSELYFGQTDALKKRLLSIVEDSIGRGTVGKILCLRLVDGRTQIGINPIEVCSGDSILQPAKSRAIDFKVGTGTLGRVEYTLENHAFTTTYFSPELAAALVLALLIAIFVSVIFARAIEKRVIQPLFESMREKSRLSALGEVTRQFAHDVRSPLTALSMVSSTATGLSEEARSLLRNAVSRIQDISNTIGKKPNELEKGLETSLEHLATLIDKVVSETRVKNLPNENFKILFELNSESVGLFGKVEKSDFMRVISNLLNNAIESSLEGGIVSLEISNDSQNIEISIKDRGPGIPNSIISRIGKEKVTFGKPNGSGLGLMHAFRCVNEWGGAVVIDSSTFGTTVRIKIPKASEPKWFLKTLTLTPEMRLSILDDESTVHQAWESKLSKFAGLVPFVVNHYYRAADLLEKNGKDKAADIYLIDYELLNESMNGTDVIERLNIGRDSVLVSSYFNEPRILKLAEKHGFKLFPKSFVHLLPVETI